MPPRKPRGRCHTHFKRHTKVRVVLRSGVVIIDKFHDSNSRFIFLTRSGKLRVKDLLSVTIYRKAQT